jgi:glucokinase
MILAGDIGATKTVLGLFSVERGPGYPLEERIYPSRDYAGLEEITLEFLNRSGNPSVEAAAFGIAGPVRSGRVDTTNLPWSLDKNSLEEVLKVSSVYLMNDIEALGSGLSILEPGDLRTLNTGQPEEEGTRAVLAAGTGLGEAFLTREDQGWRIHPTEGGHTDFSPSGEEQDALLRYMRRTSSHVSWELVCSGIGLKNILDFLTDQGNYPDPPWSANADKDRDITPDIIQAALTESPPSPLSTHTLGMFVSILGAEAGNLALKVLATGGVYIGGGLPPRILPLMEQGSFMRSFTSKGRLSGILENIPVHVILNPRAAFFGAAKAGLEIFKKQVQSTAFPGKRKTD